MDSKTKKFYEDLFALTGTREWATLVEDYENRMRTIEQRAIDCADIETLYFLKGQHQVLRDIVNKRMILETEFDSVSVEE